MNGVVGKYRTEGCFNLAHPVVIISGIRSPEVDDFIRLEDLLALRVDAVDIPLDEVVFTRDHFDVLRSERPEFAGLIRFRVNDWMQI